MPEFHQEQYIYLAGLTHKSALIAWGAFYFKVKGKSEDQRFKLVDDSDLKHIHPPRHQTIGASSEPFGDATVEVRDASSGELVAGGTTSVANHLLVTGLLPDTEYTYKISVNGDEWAAGERRDWVARDDDNKGLEKSGRVYNNRFRTHPHPEISAPLTFAVLGDFGTGVRKPSSSTRRQREVAAALEQAVDQHKVRLVLTTGDNIYAATKLLGFIPIGNTGDEDDDWFFTFYQPYRYILNRVPVYPTVGNHDSGETEKSDDRKQLMDNFYLEQRFAGLEADGLASIGPGLFYRFRYGADFEFLCVDTSKSSPLAGDRVFKKDQHLRFIESSLPDKGESAGGPVWRVPFMHHPAYTAGPVHHNSRSIIDTLTPLFKRAGAQIVLSGHEHNFQHSCVDDINYFITGAGSKVSLDPPSRFDNAVSTGCWAADAHFLLIEGNRTQMTVTPIAAASEGNPLSGITLKDAKNKPFANPIVISTSGKLVLAQSGD
ncbi:MAG TPA: metallophosphoesterase [Blastocatellia bacterium]|nr:metallophosphoesterase [Blastocatellia bacterium]